jgi:hypothetical protein
VVRPPKYNFHAVSASDNFMLHLQHEVVREISFKTVTASALAADPALSEQWIREPFVICHDGVYAGGVWLAPLYWNDEPRHP